MPSWNELLNEIQKRSNDTDRGNYLQNLQEKYINELSRVRNDRNVIIYSTAFLQKPFAPPDTLQLTSEEINGFMSVMYQMDWSKGLCLVLHTPGGVTNAAETIVSYLNSKFQYIEVIIPTFAMSAGTMISLAADKIIMGKQSQLGPIDPQMPINNRYVSARSIVDQFEEAKNDIHSDSQLAHLWAPILQTIGPATLKEAKNALDYGESMVAKWLANRTCAGDKSKADKIAKHFNDAAKHKSHGRRIDRDEARGQGLNIEDLEDDNELQDIVLTNYHLSTIMFEKTQAVKFIMSNNNNRLWVKNI